MTREVIEVKSLNTGHVRIAVLVSVVAAVVPLLALFVAYRSVLPFVATAVLFLALSAYLVSLFPAALRRPVRGPAIEFAPGAAVSIAAIVAFLLVFLVADGYGIRGSALPRVLDGAAMAVDVPYLVADAAILLAIIAAVGLLAVLARPDRFAGVLGRKALDSGVAHQAASLLAAPATPRYAPVTSASDGFLKRVLSPSAWVVLAICAVLAGPGLWLLAGDPQGRLGVLGFLLLAPGAPVTAWAVLQTMWRPDKELGVLMASLARTLVVPFLTALPIALLTAGIGLLPPVADRIRQFQTPELVYQGHEWFPLEDQSLVGILGVNVMLGGIFFSLLAGLIVTCFLVLPITAFFNPAQAISDNMLDTSKDNFARNTAAMRAMAVIVPLAFIVPALMHDADADDARWWVALVLLIVGTALLYFVWSRQRVDHAKRSRWGVQAAIRNPGDAARDFGVEQD